MQNVYLHQTTRCKGTLIHAWRTLICAQMLSKIPYIKTENKQIFLFIYNNN